MRHGRAGRINTLVLLHSTDVARVNWFFVNGLVQVFAVDFFRRSNSCVLQYLNRIIWLSKDDTRRGGGVLIEGG